MNNLVIPEEISNAVVTHVFVNPVLFSRAILVVSKTNDDRFFDMSLYFKCKIITSSP